MEVSSRARAALPCAPAAALAPRRAEAELVATRQAGRAPTASQEGKARGRGCSAIHRYPSGLARSLTMWTAQPWLIQRGQAAPLNVLLPLPEAEI